MSHSDISDHQISAYLREELPLRDLARIEQALRSDPQLQRRASRIIQRPDSAGHDVGTIWRSERLSCPPRNELGEYLLGTLPDERANYISFHFRTLGCRYCAANIADLQAQSESQGATPTRARQRRYFESSAGHLRSARDAETP